MCYDSKDLSNCHLSGPQADLRPWLFNLSRRGPRWHGQTWADYLAHRIAPLVRQQGWRGSFYDDLSDLPPSPLVDVDNDGQADGGILHGVNVWRAGECALLSETRRLLPSVPILVNGDPPLPHQRLGPAHHLAEHAHPIGEEAAVGGMVDRRLQQRPCHARGSISQRQLIPLRCTCGLTH